jgi:hypothetical protein
MVRFELCCLSIFLINLTIVLTQSFVFAIPPSIFAYRHGHPLPHVIINICAWVLTDLVIGTPFIGIPYWLALFVSRKKSQIAKWLFYIVCVFMLMDTYSFTKHHGFFSAWTLPFAFEFIAMVFAASLLPSPNSGQWEKLARYRV